MKGKIYDTLTEYYSEVTMQISSTLSGTYTQRRNTEPLLQEIADGLSSVEPEAVDYLKKVIDDDSTSVHKLHIAMEECEQYLKDIDSMKCATEFKSKGE